jgi:hypothetical protein
MMSWLGRRQEDRMTRPTGRRLILLGLITTLATALGACSTPVRIPEPSPSPTGTVTAQLDQALKVISAGSDKFGVYLEDLTAGTSYSYQGDYSSQSASMAKPMIVAMALRKAGGVDQLSAENQENARLAITHSDNDAAQALWDYAGGGAAYTALAAELGMTNTHLDQAKPTQWSWTWTTPADQVKLLDALADGRSSALTQAESTFIYDLMGQVEDDQTWGVGQPKSATVNVHLKNGWVQFKSSDGLWAVNSIGTVKGDGRNYRLAVMTRDSDFDTGRELTSTVGKWVFAIQGTTTK